MIDTDHNQSQPDPTPEQQAETSRQHSILRFREAQLSGAQRQLPKYQCHKKVWALKIKEVIDPTSPDNETDGSRILVPADEGYAPLMVDHQYVSRHKPVAGGYWVQYDDGYTSFSPSSAFESGYTAI